MSGETLRRAAAEIRVDAVDEYEVSSEPFWLALADWLEREAQAHIHTPAGERSVYDMPDTDDWPAVRVARAYLGDTA